MIANTRLAKIKARWQSMYCVLQYCIIVYMYNTIAIGIHIINIHKDSSNIGPVAIKLKHANEQIYNKRHECAPLQINPLKRSKPPMILGVLQGGVQYSQLRWERGAS